MPPLPDDLGELMERIKAASATRGVVEEPVRHEEMMARERERMAEVRKIPVDTDIRTVVMAMEALETRAVIACREALLWRSEMRGRSLNLLLSGGPGVGKTVAGCRAVLQHQKRARYALAAELSSTPDFRGLDEDSWRAWREADLLFVDEIPDDDLARRFGAERAARTAAQIRDLLMLRKAAGLATILAGNVTRTEFVARYVDPALASRLEAQAASGQPWFVGLGAKSLRAGAAIP